MPMNPVVYFTDKKVAFLSAQEPAEEFDAVITADEQFSTTKVIHFLETCNRIAVLSSQPQEAFQRFAAGFVPVEAAGGAVFAPNGRLLTMQRRGRCDLPKGHVERGESPETCAVREVYEETGVSARIAEHLCDTWHAYDLYGRWELKCTHWYAMTAEADEGTVPQTEEDIESAEWTSPQQLDALLEESYPTIRCVVDSLRRNPRFAPFLQTDCSNNEKQR